MAMKISHQLTISPITRSLHWDETNHPENMQILTHKWIRSLSRKMSSRSLLGGRGQMKRQSNWIKYSEDKYICLFCFHDAWTQNSNENNFDFTLLHQYFWAVTVNIWKNVLTLAWKMRHGDAFIYHILYYHTSWSLRFHIIYSIPTYSRLAT